MFLPKTNFVLHNHMKNDLMFLSRLSPFIVNNINKSHFSELANNIASIKRGTGGRSSFSGIVATVFGASGFLGKYVVNELGKIGSQVIIPYRGTSYSVRELRVMGDLGQVLFLHMPDHGDENIRKAIKYSNVVINLIGKDTETKNFSHEQVHVDIAARIARLSHEMGIGKLIHMSALGAHENAPRFVKKNGSSFFRTKAIGESEVRREFPDAIVFRPSDIYGHQDRFLMYFIQSERRIKMVNTHLIPLWQHGRNTVKQPVFAGDVAKAISFAVRDPESAGLVVEAVGPYRYRLDHLLWWIYMTLRYQKHQIQIIDINPYVTMKIKIHEKVKPIYPLISMERLERECQTDEVSDLPGLEDLGLTELTNIEDRIFYELRYKRKYNFYWDALNEIPSVPPPPRIPL